MHRDVGELGESAFRLICQQAGYLVHRPDNDRLGWDFLVEDLVGHAPPRAHLEKAVPPLEFRVQVKSTDGPARRVTVSLAHMLRLSALQMPVFFCVLAFAGQQQPVRAFFVHLGEDLIERALARVRRLSVDSKRDLKRCTLDIPFGAAEEIAIPFDQEIREHINRYTLSGMAPYIEWKNNFLETAGYADPRIESKMTFEETRSSDIVDFFLGLKEELNIKEIRTVEHRFGIPVAIEPNKVGQAVLSITDHHPQTDAVISIRRDPFSPTLEFPASCYAPPPALNLSEEEFRLRFVTSTFEIVLWPFVDKLEFRDVPRKETRMPLKQLSDFAAAMHLLSEPDGKPCLIDVAVSGRRAFSGSLKINSAKNAWRDYAQLTQAAERLASLAGVITRAEVSLLQLLQHKAAILDLARLADGAPTRVTFENPSCHLPDSRVGFLKVFSVPIGNYRIAGIFAVVGKSIASDQSYRVDSRRARFIRIFAKPVTEEWSDACEAELLDLASEALTAENITPFAV